MEENQASEKFFEKNLDLFAHVEPLYAQRIAMVQPEKLFFCYTKAGELNLQIKKDNNIDYFYSQENAKQEVETYYAERDLSHIKVIYLYGIGLGYDYIVLRNWLKEDEKRHLVIFEDDLEVVFYWLHTSGAMEILQDIQVTVFCFQDYEQDRYRFSRLHCRFILAKPLFIPLEFYQRSREDAVYLFSYALFFDTTSIDKWSHELLQGGDAFFDSFYHNMMYMPESYAGNGLFGRFKNVPAIICGAGPSLHKNIDILKTLTDRALIFAGGSSLNILNEYGVNPHFGAGVDPNPEQQHRLIANHSFDLPFLYCPRMKSEALRIIPGELLYVSGSGGYDILDFFEQKMGVPSSAIDGGYNVINFCTSLARWMGCNPLIFVGMDLAYTDAQAYARGIPTHPLWMDGKNPYDFDTKDDIILRNGIDGKPVKTTWKWINESDWLFKFLCSHPEMVLVNSTEGGIGFCSIPNIPLKDTAEIFLTSQYDFSLWIHGEIQSNKIPMATRPKVWGFIQEWKESLERCLKCCKSILMELNNLTEEDIIGKNISVSALYSPSSVLTETLLEEEVAFQYLVNSYRYLYSQIQTDQLNRIHKESLTDPLLQQLVKYEKILEERYQFIVGVLEKNLRLLNRSIKEFLQAPEYPLPEGIEPCDPDLIIDQDHSIYRIEGDRMILEDSELDLHIEESFDSALEVTQDRENGWALTFYPDGQLEMETSYRNGQMHGPSRVFSPENKLIAQEWFVNGKRQGKSWRFFPSGRLYGLQRYRDGVLCGKQEVFYEDGKLKTVTSYKNGLLDGDVFIYYPNGSPKRELHYREGRRHGKEKMWNPAGKLIVEVEYDQGTPVGKARQWTPQGQLFKEVEIQEYPKHFNFTQWGSDGKVIRLFNDGVEDTTPVYEIVEKQTDFLHGTVDAFMKKVDQLLAESDSPVSKKIKEEVAEIKIVVHELEDMKRKMTQMFIDNQREKEEYQKNKDNEHE